MVQGYATMRSRIYQKIYHLLQCRSIQNNFLYRFKLVCLSDRPHALFFFCSQHFDEYSATCFDPTTNAIENNLNQTTVCVQTLYFKKFLYEELKLSVGHLMLGHGRAIALLFIFP